LMWLLNKPPVSVGGAEVTAGCVCVCGPPSKRDNPASSACGCAYVCAARRCFSCGACRVVDAPARFVACRPRVSTVCVVCLGVVAPSRVCGASWCGPCHACRSPPRHSPFAASHLLCLSSPCMAASPDVDCTYRCPRALPTHAHARTRTARAHTLHTHTRTRATHHRCAACARCCAPVR
jgi:hypothetical protein